MITKLRIQNFKIIDVAEIDLSASVVCIGPNNGGKTSVLQALSLFSLAVQKWGEWFTENKNKKRQNGISITTDELINIPMAECRALWKDLQIRARGNKPVSIEIYAEGETAGKKWKVGFNFKYGTSRLLYIQLLKEGFPDALGQEKIAYLPPVSGLNPQEDKLETGSILRYIGSGNSASVLRNVCFHLYTHNTKAWETFVQEIDNLFKIRMNPPTLNGVTGLLRMTYTEAQRNKEMDVLSLGSGAKQAVMLFAYLYAFPSTITLIDEPDSHLEVILQSEIYHILSRLADEKGSQIIIASHSVGLLKAIRKQDNIIAVILGKIENIKNERGIRAALDTYGYHEYIAVKQKPRILYVEGRTDFDFLKEFCRALGLTNELQFLENDIYVHYIGSNDTDKPKHHFAAFQEFIDGVKGFALFDNLSREDSNVQKNVQKGLHIQQWKRREIENYLPIPQVIEAYAKEYKYPDLIDAFKEQIPPAAYAAYKDAAHKYWLKTKISNDLLEPVFEKFFRDRDEQNKMYKSNFYQLVQYAQKDAINPEIPKTIQKICRHLGMENVQKAETTT